MAQAFSSLLAAVAIEIGVSAEALQRAQELVIDDHVIGLHLELNSPRVEDSLGASNFVEAQVDSAMASVMFFTLLGEPHPDRLAMVCSTLLAANCRWAGTAGGTLGLQQGSNQVVLCDQLPLLSLDGPSFAMVLNSFCDTAAFWKNFVAGDPWGDVENQDPIAAFRMLNMA